jgi:hypothetical protein
VRAYGLTIDMIPVTPTLSPQGEREFGCARGIVCVSPLTQPHPGVFLGMHDKNNAQRRADREESR